MLFYLKQFIKTQSIPGKVKGKCIFESLENYATDIYTYAKKVQLGSKEGQIKQCGKALFYLTPVLHSKLELSESLGNCDLDCKI